jgi:hypothetical protein
MDVRKKKKKTGKHVKIISIGAGKTQPKNRKNRLIPSTSVDNRTNPYFNHFNEAIACAKKNYNVNFVKNHAIIL